MQEPHSVPEPTPNTPLPGSPPAHGRRPWWHFALFGCAGCSTLMLAVGLVLTFYASSFIQSVSKGVGSISQQTVTQQLGDDVPIYPNSQLNEEQTRSILVTFRTVARLAGKEESEVVKGGGLFTTSDSPEQVLAFYEKELPALGWSKERTRQRAAGTQLVYKKDNDYLLVQPRKTSGDTTGIVLFRGSEGLIRQQESFDAP